MAYDVHIDDEVDEPEKGEKTLVKFLAFLTDKLKFLIWYTALR